MPEVTCTRCGLKAAGLEAPPTGGQLGIKIQNSVCRDCWQEWVDQQVLFINHYGLQMADPEDRSRLREAMKEFLNLDPA